MSQVKQILRMHLNGKGIKPIARDLGISKNTVKAYVTKAEACPMSFGELLGLEDPELERMFHTGNPAYKDPRYEHLKELFPYLTKELRRTGVTRHLLWEEYCGKTSDPYAYTQFCHHLRQYRRKENPSMVLEHAPGDKLYIDFAGKTHSYVDLETGEVVTVQLFIACLPYSDLCFAMAVPTQRISDFLYALSRCLEAIGGVPQTLVPDNLKSAITKADRYEPDVTKALEDFANHYGTTVTPARPYRPKDKSMVENQVKMAYTRIYAKLRDMQFFDLRSLNLAIMEKVREHNQTRMQEKDLCREECFLAHERHTLAALPQEDFEIKYYRSHMVSKNNHIRLGMDRHYYSVPYIHIGRTVSVVYTRSLVRIYLEGEQIALHPREYGSGRYTTKKEHLCSQHQFYLDRSPAYYMQLGLKHSESLYAYMEAIFKQDRYPEQLYRTCDGILSLSRKTPPELFAKACDIARENQAYSYHFIKRLLENNMVERYARESPQEWALPEHGNIHGNDNYR